MTEEISYVLESGCCKCDHIKDCTHNKQYSDCDYCNYDDDPEYHEQFSHCTDCKYCKHSDYCTHTAKIV